MDERRDFRLGADSERALEPEPRPEWQLESWQPEARRRGSPVLIVAVLVLAAAGAAYFFLTRRAAPEREAAAPSAAPAAAAEPEAAASGPIELPSLAASDAFVREAVAALSRHPQLAAWLANDELIRRFVAAVDNLAQGTSPAAHAPFLRPAAPFAARQEGGGWVVDPAGYQRYDLLAEVADSLDVAGTAELLRRLEPLLDEAYRDLGYPGAAFREPLARAVRRVLAVPTPGEPIAVEPTPAGYRFADPQLEELDAASKHLLRMGPRNLATIQAKARAVAAAAALDVG